MESVHAVGGTSPTLDRVGDVTDPRNARLSRSRIERQRQRLFEAGPQKDLLPVRGLQVSRPLLAGAGGTNASNAA